MSPRPRTNLDRFLDRVGELSRNPDDCWMWQGQLHPWGYGRFEWRDGVNRYRGLNAHRASYLLFVDESIDGLHIDHLCRNRRCVNPCHLEAVTMRENILRGEGPAAHNARLTHCKHGHEFTPENTFARGEQRLCATCERARWKRLSDKRRSPNPRVSTHGTNSKYTLGCRCDDCRAGHAEYQRNYMRVRRARASVSVLPP